MYKSLKKMAKKGHAGGKPLNNALGSKLLIKIR